MGEKAQVVKKVVSQETFGSMKFRVSNEGKKVQCKFCKSRVIDIIHHLKKCYRNPQNAPKIELDWDYIDEFEPIKEFLIQYPCTDKEREFNDILAPQGNPFEPLIEDLLKYAKELPKAHKDATLNQKLDKIITKGIEVRLLNKEEYISRLKAKVRRGYRMFLFDPFKPTTEEEIEANKDELWDYPPPKNNQKVGK
ncbi:MAG: hypothetical protein KGD61_07535 [Candidatus Lokiarchaeota archaeon]|nr:hypothetical protein [Candidatus Lokiarchaeota archaeon]